MTVGSIGRCTQGAHHVSSCMAGAEGQDVGVSGTSDMFMISCPKVMRSITASLGTQTQLERAVLKNVSQRIC